MCCGSKILNLKNKEAKLAGYGHEVDFLPVGSVDKSGDAIVFRYGEATFGK